MSGWGAVEASPGGASCLIYCLRSILLTGSGRIGVGIFGLPQPAHILVPDPVVLFARLFPFERSPQDLSRGFASLCSCSFSLAGDSSSFC